MEKIHRRIHLFGSLLLMFFIGTFIVPTVVQAEESELLYYYYSENNTNKIIEETKEIIVSAENIVVEKSQATKKSASDSYEYGEAVVEFLPEQEATYRVNVPQSGYYYMKFDYYIPELSMSNPILGLKINNNFQFYESKNLVLESVWKDKTKEYKKDEYGNDMYVEPARVYRWQTKKLNSTIYNFAEPYKFYFEKGENEIQIASDEIGFSLGKIYISGKEKHLNFEEYKKDNNLATTIEKEPIVIEGEKYSEKTHSYIRGSKTTEQNFSPYETGIKKINILSDSAWEMPNEGVSYKFNIEETGVYYISLKYGQGEKKDMPAFKQIKIDGKYPVKEMVAYPFPYTKSNGIRNETLNVDGEAIPFYFEAGDHELSLVTTSEAEYRIYEELMAVVNRANDLSLEIKVITGGKADKNRDWEIESYLPTLKSDLLECADILEEQYQKLVAIAGKEKVAQISNLQVAIKQLVKFANDTNFLVNNMEQFVQGSSSVVEYVALVLPTLLGQPIAIDQIYITTSTDDLPDPSKPFFYNLTENVKKFFISFVPQEEAGGLKKEELNVWANRSAAHIDVLKEMIKEFEAESGIKVNISMMPSEEKLLLATSSGNAPDVVVGTTNYRPFDFAMRGAMYDLRTFDDFNEVIGSFENEMLVPFIVGESCFALPETANFQILYYRTDILDALQLKVPQTWDDVVSILPTLSRYGMDFCTTIATAGGMKHFGATMPFIQQYNGKIYSEDGTKVELGDPNTVQAFKLMTDLYSKYSLPENIPNFFNNFKKGITPIGIGDLNTYILLKNAAPEIAGQWAIAPSVGIKDESGEILRYQPSVATSNGIMRDVKNPEAAWQFLKWYMSDQVQIDYANQLQLRYGPQFIWNTANMNAMRASVAFSNEDRDVILEQLEQTKEIPRNPAYFAVEREVSNAWNMVVFDGVPPRTALDQAITRSNREITRKLKEFGYVDENGNKIKDFTMATGETVERWKNEK